MSIVALTNSSSPVTVERATADSDPYERETQLNGLALNFDAHDHTSAKGLGVGRVQTSSAPAASGQVRVSGDAWQWWGATAGALRTALDLEGAQTVSGAKTFTSSLTLSPAAGVASLVAAVGGSAGYLQLQDGLIGATNARVYAAAALELDAAGNIVAPARANAISLGVSSFPWTTVYATTGTIQPSSAAVKQGITPLDPLACYEAAKSVKWFEFAYLPPAYQEPPEQEGQEPEDRQRQVDEGRAAHARMLVETAPARNQRGFVFPDTEGVAKDEAGGTLPPVPELFGLSDRESTTPQADLATLGCAMQEVIRRLEALEAGGGA